MLIESWGQIKVVGDTGHITEALALAEREKPEVILTELDFRSGSSQDLLPKLLSVAKARVLILTHVQDVEIHRTAICNGARRLDRTPSHAGN
jgi:DNA-binding NarL/FixJ family response regulator